MTKRPLRNSFKYSKKLKQDAVKRYLKGQSTGEIEADLGIERRSILRAVEAAGHALRQPGSGPKKSRQGICVRCDSPFSYEYRTVRRSVCNACLDARKTKLKHPERPCPDCGKLMSRSLHAARCLECQRSRQRKIRQDAKGDKGLQERDGTCSNCGQNFLYVKLPGRGGVRQVCDDCQRQRKQVWSENTKAPLRIAYGLGVKPCEYCGKEFQPANSIHRYCSKHCSNQGRQIRIKRKAQVPLGEQICQQCGSAFKQKVSSHIFCTDECRYKAFKEGRYAAHAYSFEYRGVKVKLNASRVSQMRRDFGLLPDDYQSLWVGQDGKCAICQKSLTDRPHPHIDHNHQTMKVRGLLCVSCNMAIGYLKDDLISLGRAMTYLQSDGQEFK